MAERPARLRWAQVRRRTRGRGLSWPAISRCPPPGARRRTGERAPRRARLADGHRLAWRQHPGPPVADALAGVRRDVRRPVPDAEQHGDPQLSIIATNLVERQLYAQRVTLAPDPDTPAIEAAARAARRANELRGRGVVQ